ncbi:MAG: hypothetical protein M3P51_05785, partial [Chloroflexota bacterium]|nr:hypothetical protein [Chloroflexota bacterium]
MSRLLTLAPVRTLDPERNPVLSRLMRSEDLLEAPGELAEAEALYGMGDATESLHAPDRVVEGQRRVIAGSIERGDYVLETHEGIEIWEHGKRAALYGLLNGESGAYFFGSDPRQPEARFHQGGMELYHEGNISTRLVDGEIQLYDLKQSSTVPSLRMVGGWLQTYDTATGAATM